MRTLEEREIRGEVGRLFNREVIPGSRDFTTDLFERPWRTQWRIQETTSTSGGGFILSLGANTNTKCSVSNTNDANQRPKENRKQSPINEPSRKNTIPLQQRNPSHQRHDSPKIEPGDCRDRIKDGSCTSDYTSPSLFMEDKIIGSRKQNLLPCEEVSPMLPLHHEEIKPEYKTQLRTLPSAAASGKCPRQRKGVTFVGNTTWVEKSNQIDTVIHCDFMDLVAVSYIRPVSEYSKDTRSRLWYSRRDISRMKNRFLKQEAYFKKGRCPSTSSTLSLSALTSVRKSHNARFLGYKRTIAKVVNEQERQRWMCRKIYGRIVDSSGFHRCSGILDPERLRDVYTSAGNTIRSRNEATMRAQVILGQCSSKTIHEERDNRVTTTATNSNGYCDTSLEVASCLCCSEVSTTFSGCITCVFSVLLAPFLEQRDGPLFLDMGDEMIVT